MSDTDPQRRQDDHPTTTKVVTDRTVAVVFLVFSIAFLYQMVEVLKQHTCWCDFAKPAGVSEVLFALVCGLIAIAAALGLDVTSLIKGFQAGGRRVG